LIAQEGLAFFTGSAKLGGLHVDAMLNLFAAQLQIGRDLFQQASVGELIQ